MFLIEWWPIVVAVLGVWVRVEVGQALNKSAIKNVEKKHDDAMAVIRTDMKDDRETSREMFREIREDIKTLLSRSE